MNRISLSTLFFALCAIIALTAVPAGAQDFQKTYPVGPGGVVSISNVSGDVNVKGYDGQVVAVSVYKEGPDRDKVDVEDLSSGNRVDLKARYPQHCNCNASLRFEVSVPRGGEYNIDKVSTASGNINISGVNGRVSVRTASGDVKADGINGEVDASTASGEVQVRNVAGIVSARSASGNVDAEISTLEGSGNLKFSTASGDVRVKLPANADADINMSTASGDISTDFPISIRRNEYGPGSEATGRLGSGSRSLKISSASGNVSLLRQ